jgi:hypothetical protein
VIQYEIADDGIELPVAKGKFWQRSDMELNGRRRPSGQLDHTRLGIHRRHHRPRALAATATVPGPVPTSSTRTPGPTSAASSNSGTG